MDLLFLQLVACEGDKSPEYTNIFLLRLQTLVCLLLFCSAFVCHQVIVSQMLVLESCYDCIILIFIYIPLMESYKQITSNKIVLKCYSNKTVMLQNGLGGAMV